MRCGAAGERKREPTDRTAAFVEAALRRLGFTDPLRTTNRDVRVAAGFRVATVDLAACSRAPSRLRSCTGRLPDELQAPRNPTSTERRDAVA